MPGWEILLDNPILTKHVRTRLRPNQVLPWAAVVVVLCLCIVWGAQAANLISDGTGLAFLLGLQAIILVFIGAAQVGGAVGGVRESGIIDFHRVSPLPPFWMAVGFFFGAPSREYVLFGLTLPFTLLMALFGPSDFLGWLEATVPLITTAWVFHGLALISSLVTRRPKGLGKGAGGGIIVLALFLGAPFAQLLMTLNRRLIGGDERILFFGAPLPWLLFLLIYQAAALVFVFLAATRKLRADRMHAFSKRQALAAMATFTLLVLGAAWNFQGTDAVVLVVLYFLVVAACFLSATITPNQAEYLRGVRRALRQGRRRASAWEDEGSSRPAVFLLCVMVFLGALSSWELIAGNSDPSTYSQTIAVAVFTVAYTGLGLLYFQLRLAKSGSAVMSLFLFFVWLLPVLLGSISAGVGSNQAVYTSILCVSPITGIAMSSGLIATSAGTQFYKLVALTPAISFAFVFNFLVEATLRRIDRGVRRTIQPRSAPSGPFDYLVAKPAGDGAVAVAEEVRFVLDEPDR